MKRFSLCAVTSLVFMTGHILKAEDFSVASVAQQILKDEGYEFFRFTTDKDKDYHVVVEGSKRGDIIIQLRAPTDVIVAVQVSPQKKLQQLWVFCAGEPKGKCMRLAEDLLSGPASLSKEPKAPLGQPFLTLHGTGEEVRIILRPGELLLLPTEEEEAQTPSPR